MRKTSWAAPFLYLVTDNRGYKSSPTLEPFLTHVEHCIKGGVDIVQLRDKECTDERFFELGTALLRVTQKYNVPLVVNDRIHIAKRLVGCNAVHIGRTDGDVAKTRAFLGATVHIGWSIDAGNMHEESFPLGCNLLGVGPVYATKSKPDAATPMGLEGLVSVVTKAKKVGLPVVAIGGITSENICDVMTCGVDGVAVIGALMDA
eukprot:PhF_6_TR8867/c0_g1_i1/m.14033/K00788/thiE; thiamine-phosphate pyrophosphorylase